MDDGQLKIALKPKPYVCKSAKPVYPAFVNCTWPLIYYQPTHSCYGDGTERKFKTWALSEDYCISVGGHSASIHSHGEQVFLSSLLMISDSNFWIGASSNDGGVTWKWSDNSKWDYNPWVSNFPSRKLSGCGINWGSGIIDTNCSDTRTLICQIKL
uniref:C-type lectin domain-containing protein n=1 Tax=Panagrolaimus sp. ES5 TaxID=591445 RepID=A0AC34F4R1_9BILA